VRARVAEPEEHADAGRSIRELIQLHLVVDHERPHARFDGLGDLGRLLDRMRVNHPLRGDAMALHERAYVVQGRDVVDTWAIDLRNW